MRAPAKNEGKPAVILDDAFAQELKKQVCNPDWKYSLPNSADVADRPDELFETDYEAGSQTLEEARTAMHSAGAKVDALADKEERRVRTLNIHCLIVCPKELVCKLS